MNVLSASPELLDELLWDVREAMLGSPAIEIDVEDLQSDEHETSIVVAWGVTGWNAVTLNGVAPATEAHIVAAIPHRASA